MSKILTATPDGAPADASADSSSAAPLSDEEALLAAFGANDEDTPEDEEEDTPVAPDSDDDADDEPSEDEAPVAAAEKPDAEEERRAGLRLEDYTQKTMQLAEERRQAEAARQEYLSRLELLAEMQSANVREPNWEEMRITHTPEEINDAFREWSLAERNRAKVQAELQQERARTHAQMQEAEQARISEEITRLRKALPEGKSDETFKARVTHLTKYGMTQGFTPDELASTNDHRAILLLDKAERYDALMAKAKNSGKAAPVAPPTVATAKPTRAAASETPSATKQDKELVARLKRTGDPRAAEELFYRRLGGS